MNKLKFLDWKGAEQNFDFIGWNSGRVASAFLDSAAFVLDEKGQRKILQLRLPFLKPATYQRDPFPPHPPTRIEKFRLRPPPCRPSKGEAEDLLAFAQGGWPAVKYACGHFTSPEPWEVVYGEVLNPTPEDDPELSTRMEKQKEAHRREYESRKQGLAGRTDEAAAGEAATLEEIYNAPLRRLRKDGPLVAGYLNVSLNLVKQGGALLNQYLHEWWARRNGFDLRDMSQDAKTLLRQWRELTTEIVESRPTQGGGTITTKLQNWAGWHDKEQELLALVAYRIHFADGRRFWLSGCKVRDLQTPEEAREFGELLAARGDADEMLRAPHQEIDAAASTSAITEAQSSRFVFQKTGQSWKVIFDGRPEIHIPDTLGARYLAHLLHNPNKAIKARELELIIMLEKEAARVENSIQVAVDGQTKREARKELAALEAELEVAQATGSAEKVARLQLEIGELKAVIGNESLIDGDSGERARNNVRKAIGKVVKRLRKESKESQEFGKHINQFVSLGYNLSYNQPMGVSWK